MLNEMFLESWKVTRCCKSSFSTSSNWKKVTSIESRSLRSSICFFLQPFVSSQPLSPFFSSSHFHSLRSQIIYLVKEKYFIGLNMYYMWFRMWAPSLSTFKPYRLITFHCSNSTSVIFRGMSTHFMASEYITNSIYQR